MILSHSHQFIFLKTRKTGGTSFEIALSKYAGPEDVVTPIAPADEKIRAALGHAGPRNHLGDAGPAAPGGQHPPGLRFYNHMEAAELRALVPQPVFDGYLKVAITRNPFDYVVSWYFWERARHGPTSPQDFRIWLRHHHDKQPEIEAAYRRRLHTNPGVFASNRLITHVDGRSVVDLTIRYERFANDITAFASRVGLPASLYREFSEISAKGGYRPASATSRAMFEGFPEGRALIEKMFAEDIETHHYALA